MPDLTWFTTLTWPQLVAGSVALVVVLFLVALIARGALRTGARKLAVTAAVSIGLGASVESSWRFAGDTLGWSGIWQAIPAVLFESAAIATAARLVEQERKGKSGRPGVYVRWFWTLTVCASVVMAISSKTFPEAVGRAAIPLVAAAVWYGDHALTRREQGPVTWLLSPRRIGIRLGLISPGDQDVTHVHREYQTRRIVNTAHKIWRLRDATRGPRAWRKERLELRAHRLALLADDPMMADAADRIARSCLAVKALEPGEITGRRRAEMDLAEAAERAEILRQQIADTEAENQRLGAEVAAANAAVEHARQAAEEAATVAAHEADIAAGYRAEAEELRARVDSLVSRRPAGTGNRQELPVVEGVAAATVRKVIAEWRRQPTGTQTAIADKAKVSERTVRTVLKAAKEAAEADRQTGTVTDLHNRQNGREPADPERPQPEPELVGASA